MDIAKDLASQKIFSGRSTNVKIEKSVIFFAFSLLSPFILSYFPIISEHMQLQLKILTLNGRSTDKKNYKLFFFSAIFCFLTEEAILEKNFFFEILVSEYSE